MIPNMNVEPRLYVGTYAKYNNGNLGGAWVDLEQGEDNFWAEIKELHKDEEDPEYMFPDYEGVPKALYSESGIDKRLWDWLELDDDERHVVSVYWDHLDADADIDDALEAYEGTHTNKAEWAEEYLDSCGALSGLPQDLRYFFDFDDYARNYQIGGDMTFVEESYHETLVFRTP